VTVSLSATHGPGPRGSAAVRVGHPDYPLLLTVIAFLAFGLVMVYSASVVTAYTGFGNQYHYLTRQALYAGVGLVLMAALMRLDYHHLRVVSLPGLLASLVLLTVVLLPGLGKEVLGAQRWLRVFGFELQPSEFAKVAIIIYMAHWLTSRREQVRSFTSGFLPFVVLLSVIVALLLKQPDLGTASVVVATAVTIFFVAGAHPLQLLLFIGACALALVPVVRMAPYRMARVLAFLDPWERSQGIGYHVVQALMAFGAGGVAGVGLGVGRQKFLYLPFPHTDSIFAVIGEELGLAGTVCTVLLFLFFAYRGLHIAWYAPDQFGRLLATGATCAIVIQAFVNMGVLTSSLPFTGITLPFISSGGSSLITKLMCCGILLSVSRQAVSPVSHDQPRSAPRRRLWRRHSRPHLPGPGRGAGHAGRPA
jgi:cell division protein FtsW